MEQSLCVGCTLECDRSHFYECPKWLTWEEKCKQEALANPDHWIHNKEV